MSQAVLISIRPKWCSKIANGEKTIDVRKRQPRLDVPFKVYIYCTHGPDMLWILNQEDRKLFPEKPTDVFTAKDAGGLYPGNGKVIGEFICDKIYELAPLNHAPDDVEQMACLTREEIVQYLRGVGYGWHISDLKIYDTPKEIHEFWAYNEELHKRYDAGVEFCCYDATDEYGDALTDCGDACNDILNCYRCWGEWNGWCHRLKRPPQSWCYVEELP